VTESSTGWKPARKRDPPWRSAFVSARRLWPNCGNAGVTVAVVRQNLFEGCEVSLRITSKAGAAHALLMAALAFVP
jgi:hypothetical protein